MCLARIIERYDPPIEVEAWKLFIKDPHTGRLSSPYFSHKDGPIFERHYHREGEWETAIQTPVAVVQEHRTATVGFSISTYPSGFHAFATEKDADRERMYIRQYFYGPPVVRKVRLRGVHTRGEDGMGNFATYVAREMFIEPESGAGEERKAA